MGVAASSPSTWSVRSTRCASNACRRSPTGSAANRSTITASCAGRSSGRPRLQRRSNITEKAAVGVRRQLSEKPTPLDRNDRAIGRAIASRRSNCAKPLAGSMFQAPAPPIRPCRGRRGRPPCRRPPMDPSATLRPGSPSRRLKRASASSSALAAEYSPGPVLQAPHRPPSTARRTQAECRG